jgi:class I fructose-bisphosphate aldolase
MSAPSFDYGISIRMSRIFNEKSGRSVVVALDHGIALGAIAGLENLGERIEQVMSGKPEGVLLNPGAIRRYGHLLTGREAPAAILAVDFPMFHSYPGGETIDGQVPTISAEEAARLGADMVKICMIFGQEKTSRQIMNFEFVAKTIEKCHRVGLPVMVEPTTWGLGLEGKETKDAHLLAGMARMAFEIGADVVKSDFPNDPYEMKKIAEACPVPIVLLGGSKSLDIETMLRDVLVCMQRGAAGVTFGRNVWQHPEPGKMIRAIQSIVHDEDLETALHIMQ